MKKIAIITRHSVPNYGSFLQTYAIQCLLDELGYESTVIDYIRKDETPEAFAKSYSEGTRNIVKKLYYRTVWRFSNGIVSSKLRKARKNYLNESEPINSFNIIDISSEYDILLTGSDQVWNVVGSGKTKEIDENYFWYNTKTNAKIISYAASFGDSSLKLNDQEKCKRFLKRYQYISIREDTGVNLVNEMGYKARQVLDPTLSIDSYYWDELASKSKLKIGRDYALLYNLHRDSNMEDFVGKATKESGLDLISIKTTFRKHPGRNVFCPSVETFLSLFKNASCVYADSFHAIAFCLIFKIPFVVTLPREYSSRLESILRLFKLENRVADSFKNTQIGLKEINWNAVCEILEKEKGNSREWLKNSLYEMSK